MDDQKFAKYLKEKIGEYTDPQFDEDNWERLLFQMDNSPKSSSSFFQGRKDYYKGLTFLLLLSNLILLGVLLQNQKKSENLLYQLVQAPVNELVSRVDTVYLIKETFETNESESSLKPISRTVSITNRITKQTRSDSTKNPERVVLGSLIKPKDNASSLNQNISQEKQTTPQSGQIRSRQTYAENSSSVKGQHRKLKEFQEKYELVPGIQTEENDNGLVKYLKSTRISPGIGYAVFDMNSEYGAVNSKGQIGLFIDWEILEGLSLTTGTVYNPWDFKIDDHGGIITKGIKRFPFVETVPLEGEIHEITVRGNGIEWPLGMKYFFPIKDNFAPFVQAGLYFKGSINQNFIYEIQEGDSFFTLENPSKNLKIDMGGFQAILGSEFNIAGKLKPQLGLFFQKDVRPTGIEQNKYWKIGLVGTLWLKPEKNTR